MLDSGPLIGLCYASDAYNTIAVAGFRQLAQARTRQIAPLPVIFEVFKWVLHRAGPAAARRALALVQRATEIYYPNVADVERSVEVLGSMPLWRGSLEDAFVASMALEMGVPVWTMNYRDFGTVPKLTFWTPT